MSKYFDILAFLMGKAAGGGGGGEAVLIDKTISANGTYNASSDNADGFKKAVVNVPNSYAAGDEGKVVSNGALVAQSSDTVTQNGTVDTTLISSLQVNVSGGGGGLEYEAGTWTPTEDVATGSIAFSNQHTSSPIFVMIADTSEITNDSSSAFDVIGNWYEFLGHSVKSGLYERHAIRTYGYVGTAGGTIGASYTLSSSPSITDSWASATHYYPYAGSASRYWRAGRTYKWIAVWPPTT